MHPLRGGENHATSQDKKYHATCRDKKNHAIYQDKKVNLSIGPIASKLVHNAPNCSKWHQRGWLVSRAVSKYQRVVSKWYFPMTKLAENWTIYSVY